MTETITRIKVGALSNTISQLEIVPTSHYYFKNSIERIAPQLNPTANHRGNQDNQRKHRGNQPDKQHSNPQAPRQDLRLDRQQGMIRGRDTPPLVNYNIWRYCKTNMNIIMLQLLANDRKLFKSCTIIGNACTNSAKCAREMHITFEELIP